MRKKSFFRLLSLVLTLVFIGSTFAACNGGSTPSNSTGGQTTSEGSTSTGGGAAGGATTDVGTPRNETLIVEMQSPTDTPGQYNTFMQGTSNGVGLHQLMSAMMWEMDTVKGEQFGEVADGMPESNEDFTEHMVKIRQGIKWSDGENLDAHDVAFTMNMIKDNPGINASGYYNTVFESIEAIDDYTVKIITKESFPRLALRFGVTIWGNDLRIVPEHVYSKVDDVTNFKDETPVVAGPYTVKSFDPLGKWVLYERRADWESSTVGVVTGKMPQAPYILFKALGDDTTRQMALINNEVDILCEVTPEMLEVMTAQNDKIACWYDDFPYATSDDPGAKGLAFQMMKKPYDSADFRWGVALAMNFEEISMQIFEGVGRSNVLPTLCATSALQEIYSKPLIPWLEEFELDLGDGTTIKPFDGDYAKRMGDTLRAQGRNVPEDEEALVDMFGIGAWKYDPEAAEKLFIKAGLEKKADGWYLDGKPFVINMTYLADSEAQAGRGTQAAYDQLIKFGFKCNISTESSATWASKGRTGDFEIGGYWPSGGITKDIYAQINGWASDLIVPLGEMGSGQDPRWDSEKATEIIHELAVTSPDSERAQELAIEFLKVSIEELPVLTFHSGTKFVPTNSTVWHNYPSADNNYNGPWWWWSCFKYMTPEITPVA